MSDLSSDSTNFFLNGLLCYIASSRNVLLGDQIVESCLSFFDFDNIKEAKDILYKFINEKITRRKGDNKKRAELQDIMEAFVKAEENNVVLPMFVSNSFKSMPPSSGYEIIGSMLNTLFDEINKLRTEINTLSSKNTV